MVGRVVSDIPFIYAITSPLSLYHIHIAYVVKEVMSFWGSRSIIIYYIHILYVYIIYIYINYIYYYIIIILYIYIYSWNLGEVIIGMALWAIKMSGKSMIIILYFDSYMYFLTRTLYNYKHVIQIY